MLVVQAYHPGDQDQSMAFAQWIRDMGGCKGHQLLLIADSRCSDETTAQIKSTFEDSFDSVELLPFVDHFKRWPQAPNRCFALAARHIAANQKVPWMFCEPDCVALKPDWLDVLEKEHQESGKLFLGDFVSVHTPELDVPDHMSGNAIYPPNIIEHAGQALIADDLAFDMAAKDQILPKMHHSKYLHHNWQHKGFENWGQFEREVLLETPECRLFHSDKSSSLYPLLRENLRTESGSSTGAVSQPECIYTRAPSEATFCIFIKSWEGDRAWLHYCLRSIEKFASGFSEVVLMLPIGMEFTNPMCRVVRVDEPHGEDSYLRQQNCKMHADGQTDADYILFMDSDTIFTMPVTPETYLCPNSISMKITWMYSPYSTTETPWQPITEKFLGRPVEFEFMRRHPQMVPRWLLADIREFCQKQHGMTLDKYVMSRPYREFSEFNALGAFAFYFHHDRFNWINTEEVPADQWPQLTVLQKYSHGGLTPDIEAEFEQILSGATLRGDETFSRANGSVSETRGSPSIIAQMPDQEPWQDKEASIAELTRLSERLKQFCSGAVRTRQVRDVLRASGVIK